MDPQNCYICNATSVFYSRNLFKTKSKYSETRICEFVRKFLGNYPSEREYLAISNSESEHCVCIECLNKIDEYDLACMTSKRLEKELRDILVHTETLFFREAKTFTTEELFVPPFETIDTLDEYKVENYDGNGDLETDAQKSDGEFDQFQSDSDEDYTPAGTNKRRKGAVIRSHTESKASVKSHSKIQSSHKCFKCNMEFKRYG